MIEIKKFWAIAAGCLLAVGQQAAAADSTRIVDAVFTSSDHNWVQPLRLSNDEAGMAANIQQVSFCGSDGLLGGELGDPWTAASLLPEDSCWEFGGWMQAGYQTRSDGIFNTYPNHLQLQQGYMYVQKVADGSEGFDWGFRGDLVYGTDAQNTQAFGNPPGTWDYLNGWDHGVYGWAAPQLYAEVAYKDLSVKAGHFYTLLGYQVVPATGNFFYSIPWTFNFSEAFTHTGALATYKASDDVTVYAGWTLGWDTGFEQLNSGNSFLGGISAKVLDNVTATYICTAGNLGWIGEGYTHSFVVDYVINDKWEYVFQTDLNDTNVDPYSTLLGRPATDAWETIGINQYLFYTINDKLRAGGRAEWWKFNGISIYDITAGINIKPSANVIIRPEWRYRWSPVLNDVQAVESTFNFERGIFAVDCIVTF